MQSRQQPLLSLAVLLAGAASSESAAAAFAPSAAGSICRKQQPSSGRPRPLSMIVDPTEAAQHIGAAADAIQGDGASGATEHLSTLMTAAADAAVIGKKYAWEFMGMHGERISPCGGSCPPGFGLTESASSGAASGMDYFLPQNPAKMDAALKAQQAAREAGGTMPSIGAIRDSLPGGRPEVLPFPAGDPEALMTPIEQDELEWMLRDADITSRLSLVAFAAVLVDFFFFNSGNDMYREDIMEDSPGRAAEW
eukprot:CAMPEP_0113560386 /NCGR_PEP_ID=MMETSP0015_2-20120614/19403_1 /TAXON_ID=2838 /ORGANISM="Odontella" /LENGTH=251 /DNA_ID=CAMNT_0000462087 /DNA_START=84 /DNA_END=836 /DNA_ORIENTATION=+ /assembly_acc=CAM_ASM_000160